jgi:hypothetical protein
VGSLDTIERYNIEFDKWYIARIRLKEPVHDTVSYYLGGCRIMIFGGSINGQNNTAYDIYDLTCELLGKNETTVEAPKVYLPPVLDMTSF